MEEYLKECLVYRFYIEFYTFNKETMKSNHHTHSGMILARNTTEVYNKLRDSFKEVYDDECGDNTKTDFDFTSIKIEEYCDFCSDDLIIYDEGDVYFE